MFLIFLLIFPASSCRGMESDSIQEEMAQLRTQMKELTKTIENSKKREDELVKKLEGLALKEEETAKIVYGLSIKEDETAKTVSDLALKEEETAKKLYGLSKQDEERTKRVESLASEVHENHKAGEETVLNLRLKVNGLIIREEGMAKEVEHLTIKEEESTKKVGALTTEIKDSQDKNKETAKKVEGLAVEVQEYHKKDEETIKKVEGLAKEVQKNQKQEIETATKVKGLATGYYCSTMRKSICGPCQCNDDRRLKMQFFCNCQNLPVKRDCLQYHSEGFRIDGIYRINQNGLKVIQVSCDQTKDGGGWTVFQRRLDGSVKFYRNWASYKRGFGDIQHEFWLGNDNIFTMSEQGLAQGGNELRIELEDWQGNNRYAKYKSFDVDNENSDYQMHVSDYSGTAGDKGYGLSYHNGKKFTTFDKDNDGSGGNCAQSDLGGWWYSDCAHANLNGMYSDYPKWGVVGESNVIWDAFHSRPYSLKFVEMKMRRKQKE